MTNQLPREPQMTDVFSRFPPTLPPVSDSSGPKINHRKKALLGTAAVLLGGAAVFAAIDLDAVSGLSENTDAAPTGNPTPGPSENGEMRGGEPIRTPVRHHAPSAVQNGTITPTENIAIAGQVEEQMTFGQAYATAREETGPGGIFSWHGQVYNTYTVEEWQGLSLAQRQEFLGDVGYRPTQPPALTEEVPPGIAPPGDSLGGEDTVPVEGEPLYMELVIQGRPALGIDDDRDGIANAIVFMDEETQDLLALVDAEGDNRIDTAIQYDPLSQQIVGQQTLEEPFLAEMSQLEAMSGDLEEPVALYAGFAGDREGDFDEDDNGYADDEGYVNDAELPEMD